MKIKITKICKVQLPKSDENKSQDPQTFKYKSIRKYKNALMSLGFNKFCKTNIVVTISIAIS